MLSVQHSESLLAHMSYQLNKGGYILVFFIFVIHALSDRLVNYLAQKLCFWKGIIFIGMYVSVCLCVSVCV